MEDSLPFEAPGSWLSMIGASTANPTTLITEQVLNDMVKGENATSVGELKADLSKVEHVLEQIADAPGPILHASVNDFLSAPVVCRVWANLIARRPLSELVGPVAVPGLDCVRERDWEANALAMKRSFAVMELLTPSDKSSCWTTLGRVHVAVIVETLAGVFASGAEGYFLHACTLLTKLSEKFVKALETVSGDDLFSPALYFLHHACVHTLIFGAITDPCSDTQSPTFKAKKEVVGSLIHGKDGLVAALLHGLFSPAADVTAEGVGTFVARLCEDFYASPLAAPIFRSLITHEKFLTECLKCIGSCDGSFTLTQREACLTVVSSLTHACSRPPKYTLETNTTQENVVSSFQSNVFEAVLLALPSLSACLSDPTLAGDTQAYSSYTVASGLSTRRFAIVQIVRHTMSFKGARAVEAFPLDGLSVLAQWFLVHHHSNIYHCAFFVIFRTVLLSSIQPSIKALLAGSYKFVNEMIAHFLAPTKSGARGFIILIANTMRLQASLVPCPCPYLRDFLSSHHLWQEFQPHLKAATDTQIAMSRGGVSPGKTPFFPPFLIDASFFQGGPVPVVGPLTVPASEGDLTAYYAKVIGFTLPVVVAEVNSVTPAKKKKKNKKKKKGGAGGSTSEASGSEDLEGDDEPDGED